MSANEIVNSIVEALKDVCTVELDGVGARADKNEIHISTDGRCIILRLKEGANATNVVKNLGDELKIDGKVVRVDEDNMMKQAVVRSDRGTIDIFDPRITDFVEEGDELEIIIRRKNG